MSQPPDDIRITDLADPVLDPAQRAAIEWADSQRWDFSVDAVTRSAREHSGLDDFGSEDFRDRLRVWLQSVDEDAGLNGLGRMLVHEHVVRVLGNRLRLEDLLRRHPEILEAPIREPIIVAGLPRSGTTHLLNLMSADTRLRSLPYWEAMEPIPAPGEGPGRDGRDPRYVRCAAAYRAQISQMPLLRAMHDMPPEHIHEEIELLEMDFASYNLEWLARVPRWRDHYLGLEMATHFEYLRKSLQALQWLRGPRRWVLKCPQHLEWLPQLAAAFPDATIALTHRDPVSVIRSAITMLAYGDRTRRVKVDLAELAEYWIERVRLLLSACVRDRDKLAPNRSIDVLFHEFMTDDVGTVRGIYAKAGLEMTERATGEIAGHLDQNPRGKFGRVVYDLKADFGLDPAEVRGRFDFYFERFPVEAEDQPSSGR